MSRLGAEALTKHPPENGVCVGTASVHAQRFCVIHPGDYYYPRLGLKTEEEAKSPVEELVSEPVCRTRAEGAALAKLGMIRIAGNANECAVQDCREEFLTRRRSTAGQPLLLFLLALYGRNQSLYLRQKKWVGKNGPPVDYDDRFR